MLHQSLIHSFCIKIVNKKLKIKQALHCHYLIYEVSNSLYSFYFLHTFVKFQENDTVKSLHRYNLLKIIIYNILNKK